ncbi:MAG: glycosyltransferase N-terminal domain-containing protein [Burkholderiaceae bacterium]
MRLLLTHGTATGRSEGEKLLQLGDVQVWQPWDTPGAVARFLARASARHRHPDGDRGLAQLVEGCRQRGIPLVLANARFNEKSLRKARRMHWLARPVIGGLAAAWAQTEADAERLRAIGAPVKAVLGNLSMPVPDAAQVSRAAPGAPRARAPSWLLASSREGEEALWLGCLEAKKASKLIRASAVSYQNRSACGA